MDRKKKYPLPRPGCGDSKFLKIGVSKRFGAYPRSVSAIYQKILGGEETASDEWCYIAR
jgi:hypothetical protein